jgi:hypothetical protein
MGQRKRRDTIEVLLSWTKKNFSLMVVSCIFILCLLVLLNSAKSYEQSCNEHWDNQFKDFLSQYGWEDYYLPLTPYDEDMNITMPIIDTTIYTVKT